MEGVAADVVDVTGNIKREEEEKLMNGGGGGYFERKKGNEEESLRSKLKSERGSSGDGRQRFAF